MRLPYVFAPFLDLSHSVYCICPPSPFLFKFLQHSIAIALWPHLPTAASKWCDCACVCMWTSVESLTWARRECGSTALLNPGNSLRTTRHGWHPESSTRAKVCLRLPPFTHTLAQETLTNAFGSPALVSLSREVLLSVWTLDGISVPLKADRLSPSSNKRTIVRSSEFQTLHLRICKCLSWFTVVWYFGY